MKHTKGTWREYAPKIAGVIEENYRTICAGEGYLNSKQNTGFAITGCIYPADAARIVECVNALAEVDEPKKFVEGAINICRERDEYRDKLKYIYELCLPLLDSGKYDSAILKISEIANQ